MAMLYVHPVTKNLLLFVVQQDAQYLIIDHPLRLFCRAPQEFFDLQDRPGFAADFVQQQECIRLCPHLLIQPRVFNRHGQPAG